MWRFLYRRHATYLDCDSCAAETCGPFSHAQTRGFHYMPALYSFPPARSAVMPFLAEKPHEEGYGQRPRVVERAEFRGFRQMKISGLTRLAVR